MSYLPRKTKPNQNLVVLNNESLVKVVILGIFSNILFWVASVYYLNLKDPIIIRVVLSVWLFIILLLLQRSNIDNNSNLIYGFMYFLMFDMFIIMYLNSLNDLSILYFVISLTIIGLGVPFTYISREYITAFVVYMIIMGLFLISVVKTSSDHLILFLFIDIFFSLLIFISTKAQLMTFQLLIERNKKLNIIESRYTDLFNNLIDAVGYHKIIIDENEVPVDYIILDINPAYTEITGYKRSQLIGKKASEVFQDIHPKWIDRYGIVATTQQSLEFVDYASNINKYFMIRVYSDRPNHFVTVFTDITEKKKTEEEKLKQLKIESLSLLAGGIAHDYNNILMGILGNVNILQMSQNKENQEILQSIETATLHAAALTKQLLTFSKGGKPIIQAVKIDQLVRDLVALLMSGSNSNYEIKIEDDLPAIEVDESQFSQVMNNLIVNAKQAMPDGGLLKVNLSSCTITENDTIPLISGNYVKITISDTGIGIPIENQLRIFDPYFSTKDQGSGLGLAICYSIMKNHNGHISVKSKLNEGCSFFLYFPASLVNEKYIEEIDDKINFSGTVLVMDDDDILRPMLKRMLKKIGFEVDVVVDGTECIEKYKETFNSNEFYTFIIMDLTIRGGKGGEETITEILNINKDAKVIVSSGYSNNQVLANYKSYGFADVLEKPYTLDELRTVITRIIKM